MTKNFDDMIEKAIARWLNVKIDGVETSNDALKNLSDTHGADIAKQLGVGISKNNVIGNTFEKVKSVGGKLAPFLLGGVLGASPFLVNMVMKYFDKEPVQLIVQPEESKLGEVGVEIK